MRSTRHVVRFFIGSIFAQQCTRPKDDDGDDAYIVKRCPYHEAFRFEDRINCETKPQKKSYFGLTTTSFAKREPKREKKKKLGTEEGEKCLGKNMKKQEQNETLLRNNNNTTNALSCGIYTLRR